MRGNSSKASVDDQPTASRPECFVIMPISDVEGYPSGHFGDVYEQIIEPAVTDAGYECFLATSTKSAHMIQLDVVTKVATAPLCICDLSTNNANVLFEYGIRQAFDLPTVLIKDDITRRIFDLNGFRDIEYDRTLRISNAIDVRKRITSAIHETVEGHKTGDQIFSLVSLMKLTKAALPTGEFSQNDARFTLIEQKLDRISANVARSNDRSLSVDTISPGPRGSIRFSNGFRVHFLKDGALIVNLQDRSETIAETIEQLHASDFWNSLSPNGRSVVLKSLDAKSPGFVPF